jgi:hypothetical protein
MPSNTFAHGGTYRYGTSLRKRRTWYADSDEETTDPTPAEDGNEGNTTQPDADKDGETFTQKQLNAVAARTKRETKAATEKALFEALGVTNATELKAKLDKAAELEQANLTELERAQQAKELAEQNNASLQAEIESLKAQQKADTQRRFMLKVISDAGAKNADDLFVLLTAKDAEKVNSLFEAGTPDEAALKAFVSEVQKSHPLYFAPAGGGSPSNKGGTPPTQRATAIEEAKKEVRKYRM